MGSAKPMGLVIVGTNPTAVDATCARIIGLEPTKIPYLEIAEKYHLHSSEGFIRKTGLS